MNDRNDLRERMMARLTYDQESGLIARRVPFGKKKPAGSPYTTVSKNGYIYIEFGCKRYLAHRLAWLFSTGVWPAGEIDHINGIRTDNRLVNLRDVSHSINMHNAVLGQGARHGRGVRKVKNRYMARIVLGKAEHYLGCFKTAAEAANAYLVAKERIGPDFPRLVTEAMKAKESEK